MKFSRIAAIAKKEVIQILRDPFSLAMGFLMPVILLFIFGYAITLDVNNLTTVIHDNDRSDMSAELVRQFRESGYFRIAGYVPDERGIDRYLDSGLARVAISIPDGFAKDLLDKKAARLQVIVDGSDSNTASIALGYISAITETYSRRLNDLPGPIEARLRVLYNPELRSRNFIIPGLVAVIMSVIAALLTSLTVSREWERGTMEQLISTTVKPIELIAGKLLPYFLIGLIDMAVSLVLAVYLFGVPLRGSVFLLSALSLLFLFGGLSFGILISIIAKSQLVASQVALVTTFMPAFILSGFLFSIANMPPPLRIITRVIPARYFVTILKGVFLKGSTFGTLLAETFFLFVYGLAVFLLAKRKFKKKIS